MEKKMSLKFEVFKNGTLIGEEVLSQDVIKIGRNPGSHLLIDDEDVSGTHVAVEFGGDNQVFINDLGGKTGTKVNGQPVGRSEIKSKDVITFGSIDIRVSFVSGARGQGNGNGAGSTAPTGAKQTKLGMPVASSSAPPPKRSSSAPPPKRSSSNPPPPPPQNGRRSSSTPPPPIPTPTPKGRPVMPDLPDSEIRVLLELLSNGNNTLEKFVDEGVRLQKEVDALKGEVQDKEEEIKSLRGDIDVLSSQLTASGQELTDKKDKVSSLESLLGAQRVRVEQLQKANISLKNSYEARGDEVSVLNTRLRDAEVLLNQIQASHDKLVQELRTREDETRHYVVENEELRLQATKLIEEFGLIRSYLEDLDNQRAEVNHLIVLNNMMNNLSGKVDRLDAYLGGEVDSLSDSTPDLSCDEASSDDGTPTEWRQVDSASTRISQPAEPPEATYSGEDTALLLEDLEGEEFPKEVPISATPTYPSKRVNARNLFVALVVLCLGALAGSVYLAFKGGEQIPEDQQKTEMVESSSPSEVEVPAVKSDSFKDEDTEALMKQVVEIGRIKNGQKAPQPQSSPFNSVKDCDDLSSDKRVQCIVYMARKARGEN